MKKTAWPWIGSSEAEMGAGSSSGDSDRSIDNVPDAGDFATPGYSALVDHKFVSSELEVPNTHGEGAIFRLHDDGEDEDIVETEEGFSLFSSLLLSMLKGGSNILYAGSGTESMAADKGHNIVCLRKHSSGDVNLADSHFVFSSPMFYKSRHRLDGFVLNNAFESEEDAKISLANIYSQMRPLSYGVIKSDIKIDLEDIVKKSGFNIIKRKSGKGFDFLVSKNELNKIAIVRYYNSASGEASTFECDIAEDIQDKINGLQVYSNLSDKCGLIFKYDKPTDVMFHMGSVSFPIDIAFISEDDTIKKICKNVAPGSLEIFGSSSVTAVLELASGVISSIGANVGDKLHISYGDGNLIGFEKEAGVISGLNLGRCIYRKAHKEENSFYSLYDFNVLTKNSDTSVASSILKKATSSISGLENVIGYTLNSVLDSNKVVDLYRIASNTADEAPLIGLSGETFTSTGDKFSMPLSDLISSSNYSSVSNKYAVASRDVSQCSPNELASLKSLHSKSQNILNKIAILYSGNINTKLVREVLSSKIRNLSQNQTLPLNTDFIRVPYHYNDENMISALNQRYPNQNVQLKTSSLSKAAGMPIPDDTKESGRMAIKFFDRAKDSCMDLRDNLNKNISVYQKLEDRPEVIKGSKGEYNESCKRNSKIAKGCLINIKEGIKILNIIQDISTTEEIISGIAGASKSYSDSIKDVFDSINIIESDDFYLTLTEATDIAIASIDDLEMILDRAKEYITKDILGIIILSG